MKLHELKIKDKYYKSIYCGDKTFELRKNDRDYQVDDLIRFTVIDNTIGDMLAVKTIYTITYVLKDVPEYGLDKDYCILGIKPLVIKE